MGSYLFKQKPIIPLDDDFKTLQLKFPSHTICGGTLLPYLGYDKSQIGKRVDDVLFTSIFKDFILNYINQINIFLKNKDLFNAINIVKKVSKFFNSLRFFPILNYINEIIWVKIFPTHIIKDFTIIIDAKVKIINNTDFKISPNIPENFLPYINGQPEFITDFFTDSIIICLDIAGSSKLSTKKNDSEVALISFNIIKIVTSIIEKYYPFFQMIEDEGDSLMIGSVNLLIEHMHKYKLGIKCAIDIVTKINEYLDKFNVHIRCGITYGDVTGGVINGRTMRWFGQTIQRCNLLESSCSKNCIIIDNKYMKKLCNEQSQLNYAINEREIVINNTNELMYEINTLEVKDSNQIHKLSIFKDIPNLELNSISPNRIYRRPSECNFTSFKNQTNIEYKMTFDAIDHKIISFNEELANILGYEIDEIVGQIAYKLLGTDIFIKYIEQTQSIWKDITINNIYKLFEEVRNQTNSISKIRYLNFKTKYDFLITVSVKGYPVIDIQNLKVLVKAKIKVVNRDFNIAPNIPLQYLKYINCIPEYHVQDFKKVYCIMLNTYGWKELELTKSSDEIALIQFNLIKNIKDCYDRIINPFLTLAEDKRGSTFLFIHTDELMITLKDICSEILNFFIHLIPILDNYLDQYGLHIQCGITMGSLCGGIIDGKTMRWFGETINRSARLQNLCKKNHVVICENVLNQLKLEHRDMIENMSEHIENLKGLGYHTLYQLGIGTINPDCDLTPHIRKSIISSQEL